MRPVRALDRPAQGLTAFYIALFAIPPVALLVGIASERSFWVTILSWAPLYLIAFVMRDPLRRLERAPRFVAWFCIGVTGATFFALGSGRDFTLAIAVGMGLAVALGDLVGTFWSARKAAND
jgi:hypothetical protein